MRVVSTFTGEKHKLADQDMRIFEQPIALATPGTIWTCPMHPEVRREARGSCPLCGMALEPLNPTADVGDNAELKDMTRRFVVGAALSIPLLWAMLGELFSAVDPMMLFGHRRVAWAQLALATPVVLWGGWPSKTSVTMTAAASK